MPDFLYGSDPAVKAFVRRLGVDPGVVSRVVLDIRADAMVVAYVQTLTSRQALEVLTTDPQAVEIRVVE